MNCLLCLPLYARDTTASYNSAHHSGWCSINIGSINKTDHIHQKITNYTYEFKPSS